MGRKKAEAAAAPPETPPADTPPVTEPLQIRSTEIKMIGLGRLVRAPENVRQTHDEAKLAELAEDIAGHGLLQSLIGYDRDEGDDVPIRNELAEAGIAFRDPSVVAEQGLVPLVLICGGGRRLAALEQLRERGAVDDAYLVPVQIRPRAEAIELSLAENLARQDMNPADQFRGFKRLIDLSGGSVGPADIAKRFGYSIDFVRQRMRLADLADEILDALAGGKITIDAAYAYASTQDLDVQRRVFKSQEKSNWQPHSPGTIRQEIKGVTFNEGHRLVRYIGLDAYEKAGGHYEDSLFAAADGGFGNQHRRLVDTALVRALAKSKAEEQLLALKPGSGLQDIVLALDTDQYGHAKVPKAPKGCALLKTDYYGFDHAALAKAIKKAKAEEIPVVGVATINEKGKLELSDDVAFVPKAKVEELKPKRQGYHTPTVTPEEQAARERKYKVHVMAAIAAAGAVLGDVDLRRIRWPQWGQQVSPGDTEALGHGHVVQMRFFVTQAEYEAQVAEAERSYDAEKNGEAAAKEAAAKVRADMLANPPAVVRIEQPPFDFFRHDDGSYPDVRPGATDQAPDAGFETLAELLEHADLIESEIKTWPTIEAFDGDEAAQIEVQPGRCRICGCTDEVACDPPCSWADETATLCDNPDCLAKAAEEGAAPPEDAGAHDEPEPVAEAAE